MNPSEEEGKNPSLNSEFLSLVRTDQDREILIREIDLIIDGHYKVGVDTDKTLKKEVRVQTFSLFENAKKSEANYLGFLKALRQLVLDMEGVDLTLAIDPTEDLIDEISAWLYKVSGRHLVITFKKKQELIAGAEVSYLGRYNSFSLDKILEEEINSSQFSI